MKTLEAVLPDSENIVEIVHDNKGQTDKPRPHLNKCFDCFDEQAPTIKMRDMLASKPLPYVLAIRTCVIGATMRGKHWIQSLSAVYLTATAIQWQS